MAKKHIFIYGVHEAEILEEDEEGAIVRELDDNSETWFPWECLDWSRR